jgi:hypothetical protein
VRGGLGDVSLDGHRQEVGKKGRDRKVMGSTGVLAQIVGVDDHGRMRGAFHFPTLNEMRPQKYPTVGSTLTGAFCSGCAANQTRLVCLNNIQELFLEEQAQIITIRVGTSS